MLTTVIPPQPKRKGGQKVPPIIVVTDVESANVALGQTKLGLAGSSSILRRLAGLHSGYPWVSQSRH